MEDVVIKTGKKLLKKKDASVKTKTLAKEVANKVGHEDWSEVKEWIEKCTDTFQLEGKCVSLIRSSSDKREKRKKRSLVGDSNNDINNNNDGDDYEGSKKSKKKSAKRSKKEIEATCRTNGSELGVEECILWRREHSIVLRNSHEKEDLSRKEGCLPYTTFDSSRCVANLAAPLRRQCTVANGFSVPSPIQAQCWPILLDERDVVGIAETGSGKTLAFALPALTSLHSQRLVGHRLPRMLVLAPTRELAMQSHAVIAEFGHVLQLRSLVIYGGVPKHSQRDGLRQRMVDCIVATPGRLKDLIQETLCDLSHVSQLVLDEADRMLDMGFEDDVRFIIQQCSTTRQTAMFSATWPAAIQTLAMEYMVDPIRIYVGFDSHVGTNNNAEHGGDGTNDNDVDDSLSANKRVTQLVEVIEDRSRDAKLRILLQRYHNKQRDNRILVFALYKKEASRIESSLLRDGWKCNSIHGDKAQDARTRALEAFKDGTCPLLVATDVAARGLDIPNVEVVINYTFPLTIEDYVHRIGRTGRAGKTGISYTFFQPTDKSHAGELQQAMKQAGQDVPDELMKFGSAIKKKEHKLYGNFGPSSTVTRMKKAVKITFDDNDDDDG